MRQFVPNNETLQTAENSLFGQSDSASNVEFSEQAVFSGGRGGSDPSSVQCTVYLVYVCVSCGLLSFAAT
jgi:hypothetical protein